VRKFIHAARRYSCRRPPMERQSGPVWEVQRAFASLMDRVLAGGWIRRSEEDAGGLLAQERSPRRARAPRGRVEAMTTERFADRGCRDLYPKAGAAHP
jgi:hypothetical protein